MNLSDTFTRPSGKTAHQALAELAALLDALPTEKTIIITQVSTNSSQGLAAQLRSVLANGQGIQGTP